MKIGLVCPYIYPENGGVAQHVRFLYENLRLRGHDVRVITASHGPQRSSEGDIIRLGVGFSVPINASVGTLTFSPRYLTQIDDMLERERFDVLHFHEPFVPFLSLFLLRESTSVNVATFHAYAGFSPSYEFGSRTLRGLRAAAARPDRGQRRRPPLHRPLLPGRLQGHPQRGGRRRATRTPSHWPAGRTARRTCCSSDGTSRARVCSTCSRRIASCARPARPIVCSWSAPGPRSARRVATSRPAACRASSSSAGSRMPRRPSCSARRTCTPHPPPVANRSGSSCSRRWPPGRPSCAPTSTATRASSAAAARACSCHRASPASWPSPSTGCSATPPCASRWAPPARPAPRSSAGRA